MQFASIPAAFFIAFMVAGAALMVKFRTDPLRESFDLGRDIFAAGFIGLFGVVALGAVEVLA